MDQAKQFLEEAEEHLNKAKEILKEDILYTDFHNNIRRKDTGEIVTPAENEVY